MRFHIAPLILIAVLTLDVITAYPGKGRDNPNVSKAVDKSAAPRCRIVRQAAGLFSHLRSRVGRSRKDKKKKKGKQDTSVTFEPETDSSSIEEPSSSPRVELGVAVEDKKQEKKEETTEEETSSSEMPGAFKAESSVSDKESSSDVTHYEEFDQGSSLDEETPGVKPVPVVQPTEDTEEATESVVTLNVCDGPEGQYVLKTKSNCLYQDPLGEFTMNEWAHQACPDHVVKPYDKQLVNGAYQFKTQHGNAGTLSQLFGQMKKEKKATEDDYRVLFLRMAQALNCLHSGPDMIMAHLSPSPDNFVLYHDASKGPYNTVADKIEAIKNGDIRVLLTNFYAASLAGGGHTVQHSPVTPLIDAPEIIHEEPIVSRELPLADVFSLGTVFLHVTDGRYAHPGNAEQVLEYRKNEDDGFMPHIDDMQLFGGQYPSDLHFLISRMTDPEPSERMTMADVLENEFFTQHFKAYMEAHKEQ